MTSSEGKSQPSAGGVLPGALVPDTYVTVSENKRVADRSLVDAIWQVVAVNETHAVLRFHAGIRPLDPDFETRIVPLHEHDFYRADHLAAALDAQRPDAAHKPSATIVRMRDR